MTIDISPELEKKIVAFCDDELNYHIHESFCADEYQNEIEAQIELLRLMGYDRMADRYEKDFNTWMKENFDDVDTDEDEDEYDPDVLYIVEFEDPEGAIDYLSELGIDVDQDENTEEWFYILGKDIPKLDTDFCTVIDAIE